MSKIRLSAALACATALTLLTGCSASTTKTSEQTAVQAPESPPAQYPSSSAPSVSAAPEGDVPEWALALEADPSLRHLSTVEPESSRTAGKFTLLSFVSATSGEGLLVLLQASPGGMSVVDAGTAWVGCGLIPLETARSLDLLCG